jgi:hypothetical protein
VLAGVATLDGAALGGDAEGLVTTVASPIVSAITSIVATPAMAAMIT